MIDSLRRFEPSAEDRRPWQAFGVARGEYVLVTLHRPSNVDDDDQLRRVVGALAGAGRRRARPLPCPSAHGGAAAGRRLLSGLESAGVRCLEPLGYLDFLGLEIGAGAIVTDSGGVQEEASALGVPCFTLRRNTERPVTITQGTNTLLGDDPAPIAASGRPSSSAVRIQSKAGTGTPASGPPLSSRPPRARVPRRRSHDRRSADRAEVLGCSIDRVDMSEAAERCDRLVRTRAGAQHMAVNAAKIVAMRHDDALHRLVDGCELVTADGQAVVWASRLLGDPLPTRVAGIDLMLELLALAERPRLSRLLPRRPGATCSSAPIARLRALHPRLVFAGYRDGYFSDAEEPSVAAEIRAARPDLLFVAMSTPRKEYFLGRWGAELDVPFSMGVGGAIDVVAGVTNGRRAACSAWAWSGLSGSRRSRGGCSGATWSRTPPSWLSRCAT